MSREGRQKGEVVVEQDQAEKVKAGVVQQGGRQEERVQEEEARREKELGRLYCPRESRSQDPGEGEKNRESSRQEPNAEEAGRPHR